MSRKGLMSNVALESEKPMPVNDTDGQNTDTQLNPDPLDQAKPKEIDAVTLNKIQEDIVAIENEATQTSADGQHIASALNVSDSLSNGMELLSDMMEEGKLTPMSVKVMDIATESVCLSIGLNPGARVALEDNVVSGDDVDTSKMKEAGQGLLKKMVTKFKEILQAIVKMIKHSINEGRSFFQRIFTSIGQVKTQLSKLAQDSTDWVSVEGKDFSNSSAVTQLSLNGQTGGVAGVVKNINDLSKYNETLQRSGYSDTVLESVQELETMLANKESSMIFKTGREEEFNKAFLRFINTASFKAFESLRVHNTNGEDQTGPDLIGNVRMVSKNDATTAYRNGYYGVRVVNGNHFGLVKSEGSQRSDDTLPVLDASGAKQVLDAAHKAITVAEAYKSLSEKQASVKTNIVRTMEKVTHELEEQLKYNVSFGKNPHWLTHMVTVQAYLNFCVRLLDDLPKILEVHTVKVLFAVLNWMNHSAKAQGGAPKKGFAFKGTEQGVADA